MLRKEYMIGKVIRVNDKMQKGYSYVLTAPYGKRGMDKRMKKALNPNDCLKKGVFSGKYLNDCESEFPKEWFKNSIRKRRPGTNGDPMVNKYKAASRLSLGEWKKRNWIYGDDVRGWFQWYCRYYIGRRDLTPVKKNKQVLTVDELQIRRYNSFKRHQAQLNKAEVRENRIGDPTFRPVQRQALLQWAWPQN